MYAPIKLCMILFPVKNTIHFVSFLTQNSLSSEELYRQLLWYCMLVFIHALLIRGTCRDVICGKVLLKLESFTVRLVKETLLLISLSSDLSQSFSHLPGSWDFSQDLPDLHMFPLRSPNHSGLFRELIPVQAQILKDGIYWTQAALIMWHINHERC